MLYKNSITYREIVRQPQLWHETRDLFTGGQFAGIITEARQNKRRIIITGAGSSYFAALIAVPVIQSDEKIIVQALATTDIVAKPAQYLAPDIPTLLISIGRSGNSPESMATVSLSEKILANVRHAAIICNPAGELAGQITALGGTNIILPPGANEDGFASTGSVSATVYALLQLFGIDCAPPALLPDFESRAAQIAALDCERIVFLGSGALYGAAIESRLKVTELSCGRLAAFYDSPLAFRHGPKVVANSKTVVVGLLSADTYSSKYDNDTLDEIAAEQKALAVIRLEAPRSGACANDALTAMSCLPFAQLLGIMLAEKSGFNPDNPSADGSINKVVQGVNIYQYR